jgi:alpha-L-fucosidase
VNLAALEGQMKSIRRFVTSLRSAVLVLLIFGVQLDLAAQAAASAQAATSPSETKEQRDARMAWWREARFGMFIHWGIYSVPAGVHNGKQVRGIGEWIMNSDKIPVAEYAGFAQQFNPVRFDADQFVRTAKQAGMKYIVLTSKHHDGFAMFKSQASSYNVVDATPFKRDIIKEMAEATRKYGLKFGLYYSQAQDWHHAGGAAVGGHWDRAQDGSMDEYIDKIAVPQVREILTSYQPDVLWWDTPQDMNPERAEKLRPLIQLRPGLITNNRLAQGYQGDFSTPEQMIPGVSLPGDWEVCMTMNDTWGYKSYDNNWKSSADLIHKLADIAGKGGNFLLNVGPTPEGLIPEASVERLADVGAWMKQNGESIYGTTAGPFPYVRFGRATRKGQTIYLHVFDWPQNGVLRVPLNNKVTHAHLLANPKQKLSVKLAAEHVSIKLPKAAPDKIDSVIALQITGEPATQPIPTLNRTGRASSIFDATFGPENAFDAKAQTTWRAAKNETTGWLEVSFDKPESIGYISVEERGNRTRHFRLEYKDGDDWKTAFEGERIGFSFGHAFASVTAKTFRLNIVEATSFPVIQEMHLFIDN